MRGAELKVEIAPLEPAPPRSAQWARGIPRIPALRDELRNAKYQLLALTPLETEARAKRPARAPTAYRAILYDYTRQRTLTVEGPADNPEAATIIESASQPLTNWDEFDAAVALVQRDERLGAELRSGKVVAYPAMPPYVGIEQPDGRVQRIVTVGLHRSEGKSGHRIVGVDLGRGQVLPQPDGVPQGGDLTCGPPAQNSCDANSAGQMARVTIRQGTTVLWTFQVLRPSASTGTNGSGVELRYVNYRGKSVLYRANVPILNVLYDSDGQGAGCGPAYRDWENQENCFQANGTDPVPGFRLCNAPAQTILDTGSDAGNFRGVAVYVHGSEVVVVSEMSAGWYRYMSMWRFDANGTLRPRFGFAAVNNPCTCHPHHHHCYWRLDFDIQSPTPNLVEEFNNPPLFPPHNWHKKVYEIRRPKDPTRHRKWRVSNTNTGAGYEIIPGANDGTADAFGVGDLWVLRYHGSTPPPTGEEDDGQHFTTTPSLAMAHIDNFKNGELVENQDVVVWYGAHFLHDELHGGSTPHIVGPDLVPFNW